MFDFNKPKIEIAEISEDKKYGRFVVEPLERGYGTTLGNSLRRIMLSSLPGAAVSQVKIEGVLHEFSSIPGVKEDVTEIIMNIKSLAIQNNSETDEPKVAYIEYEGEGVVTAADIKADSDIVIMNPDQVIATLNGGTNCKLYMELTITKGRGYISADKGKTDDMPIGVIAVDSIYTPVDRVNYKVENTRVGQVTDYDKLTMDIWTNGTWSFDSSYHYTWILSSLNFIVTVMLGSFAGYILRLRKEPVQRLKVLLLVGGFLVVAALLMDPLFPIIKRIWSSSMTLFYGGVCFLLMGIFYYLIDIKGWKSGAVNWLNYYGIQTTQYCLFEVVNFRSISDSLFFGLQQWLGVYYPLVGICFQSAIVLLIVKWMYDHKIFLKA